MGKGDCVIAVLKKSFYQQGGIAVCWRRSQTHDCKTQANRSLFLATDFLVYVTVCEGAPQINCFQTQRRRNVQLMPGVILSLMIKRQKSVRNFKHKRPKGDR